MLSAVDSDRRVRTAFPLDVGSDGAAVPLDGAARLTVQAELSGLPLVTTPTLGPWTLDWSARTVDVHGNPIEPLFLDRLLVARFDTLEALQASAGRLEADADYVVAKYVQGRTALSTDDLAGIDGAAFPGFDTQGAWAVGLECVLCTSPVPQVLVRVVVVEE